jgi:PAS domain S-box-containing protein
MPAENIEPTPLYVLLVEDSADDAALLQRHLSRNGFVPKITRVETAADMLDALRGPDLPDVILADYNLPNFSGPAALQLLKSTGLDLPFIMLSGAVSEETAVVSLRAGAHDYVSKQNLARLVPAVHRELKDASTRRNRLAVELALRASEARFHSLVEAMPLGLLISDSAGRITYANHAAERLLHYPEDALVSGSIALTSICSSLAQVHTALENNTLSTEPFEAVCNTRDGTPVEVLIGVAFLNPEALSEERQLAAFIADLSLQKKSEEVLRRTEKLAIAGRLAASIAHEINNPLEAIINCLYLVSQINLPVEARGYLDLAQKELDRVSQITIQTLRFYRASTRPAYTDIHDLISTILSLLEPRFRHHKIEVVRQFRADPLIFAHDGEIRQVLANLIGNAIDAVSEGGRIIVRTSSAHDWEHNRQGIAITVADNGMGMDSATRDRIFEPFFSTKGLTGTGLGLWVSQEIAIKYHGRIRLRSRRQSPGADGGTVFRFFLPAGAEEQPA